MDREQRPFERGGDRLWCAGAFGQGEVDLCEQGLNLGFVNRAPPSALGKTLDRVAHAARVVGAAGHEPGCDVCVSGVLERRGQDAIGGALIQGELDR